MVNAWVDEAHREFLRMIEVTERISESRMCFTETAFLGHRAKFDESISTDGRQAVGRDSGSVTSGNVSCSCVEYSDLPNPVAYFRGSCQTAPRGIRSKAI